MERDRITRDVSPDDGGIVRLFEARDEEALRQTEKAHGALIRRVAARFLGDARDYEEVVATFCWPRGMPSRRTGRTAFRLFWSRSRDALRSAVCVQRTGRKTFRGSICWCWRNWKRSCRTAAAPKGK